MSNYYITNIVFDYDPDSEIVMISAKEQIHVQTEEELEFFHNYFISYLENTIGEKRVYMLFDFNKIIISPTLEDQVAKNAKFFFEKYLYPDGGASFGRTISRITLKMGMKKILEQTERIFATEEEARQFLQMVREYNKNKV